MNPLEAREVCAHIINLFPLRGGACLSDQEIRLLASRMASYDRDVAIAAADKYKLETTRSKPVMGEFIKLLKTMQQEARAQAARGRGAGSNASAMQREAAFIRLHNEIPADMADDEVCIAAQRWNLDRAYRMFGSLAMDYHIGRAENELASLDIDPRRLDWRPSAENT